MKSVSLNQLKYFSLVLLLFCQPSSGITPRGSNFSVDDHALCNGAMGGKTETDAKLSDAEKARRRLERLTLDLILDRLVLNPTDQFQGGGLEKVPESHVRTIRELGGGKNYSEFHFDNLPALRELAEAFQIFLSLSPDLSAQGIMTLLRQTIPNLDSAQVGLASDLAAAQTSAQKVDKIMATFSMWDAGPYAVLRALLLKVQEKLETLSETSTDFEVQRDRADFLSLRTRLLHIFLAAQARANPGSESGTSPRLFVSSRLLPSHSLNMPLPALDGTRHSWMDPTIKIDLRFSEDDQNLTAMGHSRLPYDSPDWIPIFLSHVGSQPQTRVKPKLTVLHSSMATEQFFLDPRGRLWRAGPKYEGIAPVTQYVLSLYEMERRPKQTRRPKETILIDLRNPYTQREDLKPFSAEIAAVRGGGFKKSYGRVFSSADRTKQVYSLHFNPYSLGSASANLAWALTWDAANDTYTTQAMVAPSPSLMSDQWEAHGEITGQTLRYQRMRDTEPKFQNFPAGTLENIFPLPDRTLNLQSVVVSADLKHILRSLADAYRQRPFRLEYFDAPEEGEVDSSLVATLETKVPIAWLRQPIMAPQGDIFITLPENDRGRPIFPELNKVVVYGINRVDQTIIKMQELDWDAGDIVITATFSPDGERVAIMGLSGRVQVYDVVRNDAQ